MEFFCEIYVKSQYFYFVKKRFFIFCQKISYYWLNKQELLQKAKEKYENGGKEKVEKAKNKYKNLTEEEKEAKKKKKSIARIGIKNFLKMQIYSYSIKMSEQTLKFGDIVVNKK